MDLSNLRLHANPPFSTTAFAQRAHGPNARHASNFALTVLVTEPVHTELLRVDKVPFFRHEGAPWMALPDEVVGTVAAELAGQVVLDPATVQSQRLDLVEGFTAFPVYVSYCAREKGATVEKEVPFSLPGGRAAPASRWCHEVAQLVTADFKITLAYRGPEVEPAEWPTTPMSLRFNLRAVELTDWLPEVKLEVKTEVD